MFLVAERVVKLISRYLRPWWWLLRGHRRHKPSVAPLLPGLALPYPGGCCALRPAHMGSLFLGKPRCSQGFSGHFGAVPGSN